MSFSTATETAGCFTGVTSTGTGTNRDNFVVLVSVVDPMDPDPTFVRILDPD
jgi:hypothetical protein